MNFNIAFCIAASRFVKSNACFDRSGSRGFILVLGQKAVDFEQEIYLENKTNIQWNSSLNVHLCHQDKR